MRKDERFTFVVDGEERQLIAAVAEHLQRTQSDAMRLLLRAAARELGVAEPGQERAAKEQAHVS